MPQIKQAGTDNIVANWQGFPTGGALTVRAAFQCTLTYVALGRYKLSLAPTFADDENYMVSWFIYSSAGDFLSDGHKFLSYNPDGTMNLVVQDGSGDYIDPPFMNIVVFQCTDFVSIIEGPPGNP
jgi:hypothetical protein